MATASISAQSLAIGFSLARFSRASAPDGSAKPDQKPATDSVYSVADDTAALIDKLDTALDRLRGKDTRVGYDQRGRLADGPGKPGGQTASLTSASIETTEISIGADGVSLRQASIGVSRLSTGGASVDRLEVRATTAYLGFGQGTKPASQAKPLYA